MRRRTVICLTLLSSLLACASSEENGPQNNLTYAVAWQQTAAEYRALYHQGFNLARVRVESALADRGSRDSSALPLAIITDLDATVLDAADYWGEQIERGADFFDDAAWDDWIAEDRVRATPGALAFLRFCAENDVEVFYVSNRDQGEDTDAFALAQLRRLGFPYADAGHVTILRETSDKQSVQEAIRRDYEVVALLGDNLNDFSRRYYVADVAERAALMEADRDAFGERYILFPNPTDGHWIRAIFGESEPPPSAANRERLRRAATGELSP